MILGVTDPVPAVRPDACTLGSQPLCAVPLSISLLVAPISWVILLLALFGGKRSAIMAVLLLIIWAVPVGLDQVRGWWLTRHPHASPRWLRAVRAAIGDAVFDDALEHLKILHGDDPCYAHRTRPYGQCGTGSGEREAQGLSAAEGVRLDDAARQA